MTKKSLDIATKEGVGNFSTAADHISTVIIKSVIGQYPDLVEVGFRTEESVPEISDTAKFWWNIDEIDGTANFSRGSNHYGISIGLHDQVEPIVGVIAFPARRELIVSHKTGAKLLDFDGKTLLDLREHASHQVTDPETDQLFIAYDLGYSNKSQQMLEGPAKFADRVSALKSYHSSSYTLGEVALGKIDAFFTGSPTIYDIGASTVAIEAIGGKVSDMSGMPIDWNASERTFLAARTPEVHSRVLSLLKES